MRKKFHATRNLRIICIAKNIKIPESCTLSILLSFLCHDTVRFFHDIAQWRHASSYHHRISGRGYFWNKVCITENFCLIMVIIKICDVERKWPIMENLLKCMTISNGMRFTKGFFFLCGATMKKNWVPYGSLTSDLLQTVEYYSLAKDQWKAPQLSSGRFTYLPQNV